ncbi:hypothetical protein KAT95_03350 [Candidatus Parcubacteria bacterium]|nr:hypothetical protein [Candidatus Parcubacteria bacterium]
MKKIISVLILASLLVLPLGILAYTEPTLPSTELDAALENITNFLFWLLMAVAIIFLIVAGITFVTAQGDPEKVKKARDYVLYALIGVVIGVMAKGLTTFLSKIIQGTA